MRFSARLKSQVSDVFVRISVVIAKQPVDFDKTTRCSRNFKGLFSDYVPRNLFFFPRDSENVRRNFIFIGEIRGNVGKNQEKVGECRKEIENPRKICRRNDLEPTWKTLVFS